MIWLIVSSYMLKVKYYEQKLLQLIATKNLLLLLPLEHDYEYCLVFCVLILAYISVCFDNVYLIFVAISSNFLAHITPPLRDVTFAWTCPVFSLNTFLSF